jgi:hypothetical protein
MLRWDMATAEMAVSGLVDSAPLLGYVPYRFPMCWPVFLVHSNASITPRVGLG